jgi:hypothetical protein
VYPYLDLELLYLLPLPLLMLLGVYGWCGSGGISSLPLRDPAIDVLEAERLDEEKFEVMLAMLNLRMTWFAEPRICSERPTVIPGYGKRCFVQTSLSSASSLPRSSRLGARVWT